jgi:hypothetical protein
VELRGGGPALRGDLVEFASECFLRGNRPAILPCPPPVILRLRVEDPMKTTNAIVRNALAHHLDMSPSTIESWHHLELDLYLSPRDVMLVLNELEEVEDVSLSIEELGAMATVGDLQALLSRAVAREKPAHPLERVA